MKKTYVKPVFYAEKYTVSSSIAACEYHTDPNEPLMITYGQKLCAVGDNGHTAGEGILADQRIYPTTVFNDGTDKDGCIYDWDGMTVAQTGESFGKSFYGAKANNDNHVPAYNGAVMFS